RDRYVTGVQTCALPILIYAYHRDTGEIVAYVWGKRDLNTVKKLKAKLKALGVSCARIASDTWDSFVTGFKGFTQVIGKFFTVGRSEERRVGKYDRLLSV